MTNNKTNQEVIVFRGERYHGEIIEGDLLYDREIAQYYIIEYVSNTHHAVKEETLQISLNNGQEWYSMSEVAEALEFKKANKQNEKIARD